MNIEDTKICDCSCHIKGSNVLEFMGCCDFVYEQYLERDGKTLDFEVFKSLVEERDRRKQKSQ